MRMINCILSRYPEVTDGKHLQQCWCGHNKMAEEAGGDQGPQDSGLRLWGYTTPAVTEDAQVSTGPETRITF